MERKWGVRGKQQNAQFKCEKLDKTDTGIQKELTWDHSSYFLSHIWF